jgi:hypothetical protein
MTVTAGRQCSGDRLSAYAGRDWSLRPQRLNQVQAVKIAVSTYYEKRFATSTALRPPKAKEFDSAASMRRGRASFGT